MDAPIVVIDTMPTNKINVDLNIVKFSTEQALDLLEFADEVLLGIGNEPESIETMKSLFRNIDFDSFDMYHRDVESYCTWLVIGEYNIWYVTIK